MLAGRLRHRITIEHPVSAQNEYGEPVEDWATFAEAWASREDLAGREYFAAKQTLSEVTTRFRLRYIEGISPKMRILSDGLAYKIVSPPQDPEGRRRELIIMAKRVG
ncbi:MAG TPA: phage head closure protein [Longimicrobiales bacterium]